jgi:hypothetical protein
MNGVILENFKKNQKNVFGIAGDGNYMVVPSNQAQSYAGRSRGTRSLSV